MEKFNNLIQPIILILFFSIIEGNVNIPYLDTNQYPIESSKSGHSIPINNKIIMNQSFSISTSLNRSMSQTIGTYSNFSTYKLSEKFNINTALYLTQSQSNLTYSSVSPIGVGYKLGLEYKLNSNSILSIQLTKFSNSHFSHYNFHQLNAP